MSATTRFWAKVGTTEPDKCWPWLAYRNRDGYGIFRAATDRRVPAHRFAYELVIGPIPDGLEIDHLCRVRDCVNPAHMEPVTHRENILRGGSFSALNGAKSLCPQGHPLSGDNLYLWGRRLMRRCRSCDRASRRRRYMNAKEA